MAGTYLDLDLSTGVIVRTQGINVSAGAGDADKIIRTDAAGRLDASFMPVGFGDDAETIEASEALAAGDFVNIWNDGGTPKVRKADATSAGTRAQGFVLAGVSSGQNATVYYEGVNTQMSGLTPGASYFLDKTTPGDVTASVAAYTTGDIVQTLGNATSATTLSTEIDPKICLLQA